MMKHRFFSSYAIRFILAFIIAFAIIHPLWYQAEYHLQSFYCSGNLTQINQGIMLYSQDYDGRLPPAILPGKTVGWAMALQPYMTSYPAFQCPGEKWKDDHSSSVVKAMRSFTQAKGISSQETFQPDQPGFTDYWLNGNLAGVKDKDWGPFLTNDNKKVSNPEQVIILGDGDGDGKSPQSTASYSLNQLPSIWRASSDSPVKRHMGGANYAFLDGHVKWLKPEQVSQLPTSKKRPVYTFSTK